MKKNDINIKHFLTAVILILMSLSFYQYAGIPVNVFKLITFVTVPIFIFLLIINKRTKKGNRCDIDNGITRIIKWLLCSYVISVFMAYLFWGQDFLLSYRVSYVFFIMLFYFYLKKKRYSLGTIEFIIWFFAVLYIFLWLYALSRTPELTFGYTESGDVDDESRGIFRINFIGNIFLPFASFLAINKYAITRKIKFLLLFGLFFVFIILQVTRQTILFTAIVSVIYLFKYYKKYIYILTFLLIAGYFILPYVKIPEDNVISALIELSESQNEADAAGNEYIRITEYRYFFTEWSGNPITWILGNGLPHALSEYGRYYSRIQTTQKLFLSDVGYASMYVINGLVGLFFYFLLFFKSLKTKLPGNCHYASMFVLFLVLANIFASWYFVADCQIAMALCFYIISEYGMNNKVKICNKQNCLDE